MIRPQRRVLGLLAVAPFFFAQCAPTCAPAPAPPPEEAPPPTTQPAPTTQPPPPVTTIASAFVKGVDYSFLGENTASGSYTRWDPCKDPITYQIDITTAPSAIEDQAILEAVAAAQAASGHTFELVGRVPSHTPGPGVDAVIGYATLPTGVLGSGGGVPSSQLEMLSGEAYVASGLQDGTLRRMALLHEIGHMLGLGHASDSTEVLYAFANPPYRQDYNTGDLEGMRLVGRSMPCFQPALTLAGTDELPGIYLD